MSTQVDIREGWEAVLLSAKADKGTCEDLEFIPGSAVRNINA